MVISKGNFTEVFHPPKPALSFRVGIVGHRPERLNKAEFDILSSGIKRILTEIKIVVDTYYREHQTLFKDDKTAQVYAVSPLANEAARLMVEEVLGWRVVFLDRPLNPAH